MAATSMVFRENGDIDYANILLTHAIQLYDFGTRYRGIYSVTFPEIGGFYGWVYKLKAIWTYSGMFPITSELYCKRNRKIRCQVHKFSSSMNFRSNGYGDEFLWSAAWLFRATGKPYYRQEYTKWWTEFNLNYRPSEASWNLKLAQAQILLAKIDGSVQYVNAARTFCDWFVNDAPRTPRGLVYIRCVALK